MLFELRTNVIDLIINNLNVSVFLKETTNETKNELIEKSNSFPL